MPAGETSKVRAPALPARNASSVQPPNPVVPRANTPLQRTDPTSYLRQLLPGLTNLDFGREPITREQAAQLKQGLQALAAQGAAAVPAIRQFLEQNVDLSFGKEGAESAGAAALRVGLLDVLRQIGGPEALALSRQVLQTTTEPLEIALLARNLEEAAPGQYRQEFLDAARGTLGTIIQGQMTNVDVGPLFQALQTYGGAGVADDLEKMAPNWNYYAMIALAELPSGQGVPSLVRLAQDPAGFETGQYKLAFQMLAQMSPQFPEASASLLELARQNQIPDKAWRAIAAGLGGSQYQIARQLPQNTFPVGSSVEAGRSDIGGMIQTFYSSPLPDGGSAANLSQRLTIIDQLLQASSTSPAALQALRQARARLLGASGGI